MTKRIDNLLRVVAPDQQQEIDVKRDIAKAICYGMKAKGLTQAQLAVALDKYDSTISIWLSGKHNFTIETLLEIEKALDIKLLSYNDDQDRHNWLKVDPREI